MLCLIIYIRLTLAIRKEPRTLFGPTDFFSDLARTLLSIKNVESAAFRKALKAYLAKNPTLNGFIQAEYGGFYHTGGWGGSIVRDIQNYTFVRASNIPYIFEFQHIDIPVILTAEAFQDFVDKSVVGTRSVALVKHAPVMTNVNFGHIYAVMYEKQAEQDILHIYDSDALYPDYEHIKNYFKSELKIFYVNQNRQTRGICSLYAMEDARRLAEYIGPCPQKTYEDTWANTLNPFLLFSARAHKNMQSFSLEDDFYYDELALKREHFHLIIQMNETGKIDTYDLPIEEEEKNCF